MQFVKDHSLVVVSRWHQFQVEFMRHASTDTQGICSTQVMKVFFRMQINGPSYMNCDAEDKSNKCMA